MTSDYRLDVHFSLLPTADSRLPFRVRTDLQHPSGIR
jgi:hypothetical protein